MVYPKYDTLKSLLRKKNTGGHVFLLRLCPIIKKISGYLLGLIALEKKCLSFAQAPLAIQGNIGLTME
jgi:hypothetical protein